jgi:predicted amidohydrolase YtcJ
MRGVYCAVARRSPDSPTGERFHAEQRLSREEALSAYTAGSAFAAHQDASLGRLAPGFVADIAILSEDLFAIPHERIPHVRCDATILEGEVVFARD